MPSSRVNWADAFKVYDMPDDFKIGLFQGSRGSNPALDYIVKFKQGRSQPRTPAHIHWATDLLIKYSHKKRLTSQYTLFLLDVYNAVLPFTTSAERDAYNLVYTGTTHIARFSGLDSYGFFGIEFLTATVELLSICEKQTPGAFMFKGVLDKFISFQNGNTDFYGLISKANYRKQ